jgi:hypothetical protein
MSPPPKVSYWEIKEGDYCIKDKMRGFSALKKRKKYGERILFTIFILGSGLTVLLISSILYRTI